MADFRGYVAGLDTLVPVHGGKRLYINLDNAASTPPFKSVLQTVNAIAPWYSSVHRGNGFKSRLSTDAYEEARQIVLQFFGANPTEHVAIFGKNTTEAINTLSYRLGLRKTDIVLISHAEHHSNDLPWRARATVKRIGVTPEGIIDQDDFIRLLNRYKGRVKLVAISGASNVTGHVPDIHWFAQKTHEAGAQIAIDCAQLAAHRAIRMGNLDNPAHLDYIAVSGHKMYAPFGTGALIGRRDTFMQGEPGHRGGGTITFVTPTSVDWALPPESDEAGSPNVIGAVALASAIRTLEHIGLDNIAKHETELTSYTLSQLAKNPNLHLYGQSGTANRSGVVPFSVRGMPPHLVAAVLGYEWGIGVRSGCFCAQPYVMSLLNIGPQTQRAIRYKLLHNQREAIPGMVRMSIGLYNTPQEIDVLVKALEAIASGKHETYAVDTHTGFYTPAHASENFSPYFTI